MKTRFLLLVLLVGLSYLGWGQVTLPHLDPLNYTVGADLSAQTGWTALNSGDALLIASGNLSFTGLPASTGNKVTFDGSGIDAAKLFTQQTTGTVYYSFLLKITGLGSLGTTGGYFSGFTEGTGTTFGATVWLRKDAGNVGYNIGINPRTTAANTAWVSGVQSLNATLLVVISYQMVSSTANDVVKIWINPTPGATEPAASASATNTGTDLANVNRILIRQDGASATPFIEMDELRVGTAWTDVTPSGGATAPTVTTQAATAILSSGATFNGNVTGDGGASVTDRGFCYKTSSGVTLTDNPTSAGSSGTGTFSKSFSSLSSETNYFYRAYAANSAGTTLGSSDVSFWTFSAEPLTHTTTFNNTVISQTQINLSFDAASSITNADGYIILQKNGSAPTGIPDDGNAYSVGNTIGDATVAAVVASTSATSANITGLAAGTHYYFTIMPYNYNGSNNETYNYKTDGAIPETNSTTDPPLDATSEVSGPSIGSQPSPGSISSLVNTEGAAVRVFDMGLYDYGPDGQPTKITQLTIKAGTNNTADWSTTIQGIKLSKDNGATSVIIGAPTITASQIVVPIISGNLNVPDANNINVSLFVYLKSSGLTDKQILEFKVDPGASAHGFTADLTGSTFIATFANAPVSNQVLIDVTATKYRFSTQPSNTTVNTNFSAAVEAVDANNNRDLDQTSSVTLAASVGTLSSITGLTQSLVSGMYSWTDLQNNTATNSVTLSAAGTFTTVTSEIFMIFAAQPTIQASALIFSNVAVNSMTVSWTNGNGAYRIVVVKQGGAPGVPTDGATYTANAQYGLGTPIAPGEFVLYNGTNNTVNVTGLTGSTSYSFKVFEYNGGSGVENYLTTGSAVSQTTSGLAYYSNTSGDPLVLTNWNSDRDGSSGSTPTAFDLGDVFVIQSGNNMTTTASWGVSGTNSKLQIESGGTLTANHLVTFPAGTTFQIDNGGNYIQNVAMSMGSTIFAGTEVFASGSNIEIRFNPSGTSSPTAPGYGNLIINVTTGASNFGWSSTITAIQGNLTILGTGTGTTRHAFTAGTATTVGIGGNFIISGGNFYLSSGAGTCTVNLSGNLLINGGILDLANSSGAGTINVGGNVTVSSGTLTEGGSTTTSKIVFNKSGTQTFTSGGTISNIVNFEVASGSTTNLGTNIISGAGAFTLIAGGTLGIGSADGITSGITASGNIQVTGTRTYNADGNYTYNGSGIQAPGNGLPATVNDLTIAGTSDLTLAANQTVSGILTVSSGAKLTVPSSNTLTVGGNTDLTGSECLVLKSDAGNTASFICDGSISGTGTAKVERFIAKYNTADDGWHLLSSPVASFGVTGSAFQPVSGDDDLYWFDESQYLWINWLVSPFDFGTDQGYLCAYKTDDTKHFSGTLNNENHTIAGISYNPATGGGWHIIPNPFPSAIAWNSAGMFDIGYASTASGKVLNGGRSYTDVYDGGVIPAMNGFVMQVNDATNSIMIPKSARAHSSDPWLKNSGDRLIMLTAQSAENTTYQETVVRFDENASEGFDQRYDSPFLSAASTVPMLYTTLADNTDLSLNTFPTLTNSRVVPVNFIKGSSAAYTLLSSKLEELGNDVSLSLEDLKTGSSHDLRQNPSYAFTSAEGDNPHRFLLHIGAPNAVNEMDKDHSISIYAYDHTLYISNMTGKSLNGKVFVYNLMGQQLMQQTLNETAQTAIHMNAVTGYYLVKVITDRKVWSDKIFLQ